MEIIKTINEFRAARARMDRTGFVPTMGYLHDGHLSLVRQARNDCTTVVVSIFVNPTQFGPTEDFSSYPRDMERDLSLLQNEGVQYVFAPAADEIYPPQFGTFVHVQGVTEMLEGASRPLFFRGVTTVVCKLLNIVQPTRAYFGQKDAQQAVVVGKMVRDLDMPVEIVVGPTVREPDGLAMSSRNAYLSAEERQAAPVLYRALTKARQQYERGERRADTLRQIMRQVLDKEPLASIDYVSAADPLTLQEIDQIGERGVLLSLAVKIGPARLIDNLLLD